MLYQSFYLNYHNEAVKLLLTNKSENEGRIVTQLKACLPEDSFADCLEMSAHHTNLSKKEIPPPKGEVYSADQLWIVFKKYCGAEDGKKSSATMGFIHFSTMMNDNADLFSVDTICSYLQIKVHKIDLEYQCACNKVRENLESYKIFINNSTIMETMPKAKYLERLDGLGKVFLDADFQKKIADDARQIIKDNRIVVEDQEARLMTALHLRSMLIFKYLLQDLMRLEFDNRLEYSESAVVPNLITSAP